MADCVEEAVAGALNAEDDGAEADADKEREEGQTAEARSATSADAPAHEGAASRAAEPRADTAGRCALLCAHIHAAPSCAGASGGLVSVRGADKRGPFSRQCTHPTRSYHAARLSVCLSRSPLCTRT